MRNFDFSSAPLNGKLKVIILASDGSIPTYIGNVTPYLEGVIINLGSPKPVVVPWTSIQRIEVA